MLKAWFVFFSLQATVSAQTFADYPMSNVWPGISPACLAALNTTVDCLWLLAESAEKYVEPAPYYLPVVEMEMTGANHPSTY
jgi:hypothetical protein